MRDPLHWLSVRYKLPLLFIGVCLLAFGVGGYLVSRSAREALEHEIHGRLDFQCRAWAGSLEANLRLLARRTEDFASDGYIRHRLDNLTRESSAEAPRWKEELQVHLRRNKLPLVPAFLDLALCDPAGRVLLTVRERPSPHLAAVSAAAAGAKGVWYSPFLAPTDTDLFPSFALSAPVRDLEGGRVLGRIVAWVHPGVWIASALHRGLGEGGDPGRVSLSLADRTGNRLTVPAAYLESPGPAPDSEIARSGFGLALQDGVPAGEDAGARRTWFERSLALPSNGGSARVRLPAELALRPIAGLQSRFLGYGFVLAFVASLLLFFPLRFLVRPLSALRDAARRIQGGDFAARVPAETGDELGDLSRSFNLMAAAVEERTSRLEAAARDLQAGKQHLQTERDRLDAVIHGMRDGLLVLDGHGQVVVANQGARPLQDLLRGQLSAESHHTCRDGLAPRAGCAACLFDPLAPPRSCVVDIGPGVYEIHSTRLAADASGRSGRVLVSRDITDRVAQDERQIHQERLAVLGEVAAVMAHELNNPLAAIAMFNQMLAAELPDDSPLLENTAVIRRNTAACTRTIRELLDYATGAQPEVDRVDLHVTLDEVARFLRPVCERSGVRIDRDFGAGDACVSGDEIQLRQVFVNLLMNAVQAMEEEGGIVRVTTRGTPDMLEIEVADTGPGIPEADREAVFRPFFTTKERGVGTGLGLPTSRRIAEMHGGSLQLVSSGPGGTLFRVQLRRRSPRSAAGPEETGQPRGMTV